MSRGENCRRHNTIEDIIIVRGEERNTTTSRVRWHFQPALLTKRVLARIAHIKEVVLIPENNPGVSVIIRCGPSCGYPGLLVLLVNRAHQSRSWREGFIDEDKDGFLRCELDALANHVDKLADRQVLQYGMVWYGMVWKTGENGGGEREKSVQERQQDRLRVVGHRVRTEGTKYFFLSMVGMSVLSAFSHITCQGGLTSLWMDDVGDNVRECGRDTSDEFALPLPCVSLETWGDSDQSDLGICEWKRGNHARSPKGCSSLNLERMTI